MANQNSFESDYEFDDDYLDTDYYELEDDSESVDGDYDVVAIDPSDVPILSSEDLVEIELDSSNSVTIDEAEGFELGVIDNNFAGYVAEDLTTTRAIDLYLFTVEQSSDFNFILDNLSADADLYLFEEVDEEIKILGYSSNSDLDGEALAGNLEEGAYVLFVSSYDLDATDYDLTISSGDFALA